MPGPTERDLALTLIAVGAAIKRPVYVSRQDAARFNFTPGHGPQAHVVTAPTADALFIDATARGPQLKTFDGTGERTIIQPCAPAALETALSAARWGAQELRLNFSVAELDRIAAYCTDNEDGRTTTAFEIERVVRGINALRNGAIRVRTPRIAPTGFECLGVGTCPGCSTCDPMRPGAA